MTQKPFVMFGLALPELDGARIVEMSVRKVGDGGRELLVTLDFRQHYFKETGRGANLQEAFVDWTHRMYERLGFSMP